MRRILIYPQSFADSNGDGIGDLPGVIEHLDYLQWLGVDVIWFNPCFASPFRDAGYDVADYLTIAPRYGTNDDMITLIGAAKENAASGCYSTSSPDTPPSTIPWFQNSMADPCDDRYIWAEQPAADFVASPGQRKGWYLKNFFRNSPHSTSATLA